MAETENSAQAKFDKDELKEWFTLPEVAERWTRLTGQTITEAELLHFGGNGLIEIGVIADWWIVRNFEFEADEDGIPLHEEYMEQQEEIINSYIGLEQLTVKDFLFYEDSLVYTVKSSDANIRKRIEVFGRCRHASSVSFGERIRPLSENYFTGFIPQVSRQDLVITRSALDHFEQERGINQPNMTAKMPNTGKLDRRIEKTYLQIIRALAFEAGYTLETPYKDAEALMKFAELQGLTIPTKKDTIAEKLKDAANLSD